MILTLQDNTARLLREIMAQAEATRMPVDTYLELLLKLGHRLAHAAPAPRPTPDDFDRLMAEADEIDRASPPAPPSALTYSRADIYDDHD